MKCPQVLVILILSLLVACGEESRKDKKEVVRKEQYSSITSPKNNSRYQLGDLISFSFSSKNSEIKIDSISIEVNGKQIVSMKDSLRFSWDSKNFQVGQHSFVSSIYLNNGSRERRIVNLNFRSSQEPEKLTYRLISTYPHDPDAYTQGLLFDGNTLYESTGQKGASSLRIVDLKSGSTVKKKDIDTQYFGEGIAIKGDSLYMLTWESRQGMIFNKNSLEKLGEFQYPTEGWGLTSINSDTLVMSDGSHQLFFKDPLGFADLKVLEVYDHNGPVDYLNELEYIHGKIFANRYQTDNIYIIDPNSGEVEGILNLAGIFDRRGYNQRVDVLNGIAYNENSNTYFVTGKWWPSLFEISIINQQNNPI
ncbi:glutaminyl-peptide cyclotransferase [Reichenbachiella ulvae]|uniref:Glutaminyl-peptide cyclotransferase n=1 Tax=Reichenbachiella ulvae TaxID=2980104 RepID=A0ABT3CSW9_9BACT|nr:glutaminyl-peptide cyclotransferase [Reichenbachiella ulvae]MCV9386772.1 glutaminyl-peptide cyclotransferase [Reichenbachiella ulvae]